MRGAVSPVDGKTVLAGRFRRTLLLVALAAALPSVLLIVYLSLEQQAAYVEEVRRDTRNMAQALRLMQQEYADKTRHLLSTLQFLLKSIPADNRAERENLLRSVLAANPSYSTFAIADGDGILVASATPLEDRVSVHDRRYWIMARKTLRFSAGEYVVGRSLKKPVFHFALPLLDEQGRFDGVLIAASRLDLPAEFFPSMSLPENWAMALVDSNGVRLRRQPEQEDLPEGIPVGVDVRRKLLEHGEETFFTANGADGRERMITAARLTLDNGQHYATLLLSVPMQTISDKVNGLLTRNLAYLAATTALALLLASYLGRRALAAPATRLVRAVRRLGGGDLNARAGQEGLGGELGELAASFNDMAASLQTRERDRAQAEEALRESEAKFRTVFQHSFELFGLLCPSGRLLEANAAAPAVVDEPLEHLRGMPIWETPWWNDDPRKVALVRQALEDARAGETVRFESLHQRADGATIHVDVSLRAVRDPGGAVAAFLREGRDISERYDMEDRLRHMALHDPLTGLANRSLLRDRVSQAIAWAKRRPGEHFALLFLDINRFKVINDSLGHAVGDRILQEVARKLAAALGEDDTLARYGGDEFVVVARSVHSPQDAIMLANRLTTALAVPIQIDTQRIQISVSIGIELTLRAGVTADEMIRNANLAMLSTKQNSLNRPTVFTPKLLENIDALRFMEQELPEAMEMGHLHLVFQPIMQAGASDHLAGFEVLCRWEHPARGFVPPLEFIRMAEQTGLIVSLGEWVLDNACRTLAEWRAVTPRADGVFFSVNVSPKQLQDPGFSSMVLDTVRRHDLLPGQLHLEITETAIMESTHQTIERLRELAGLGVRISIDDFGAGYSNLALMTKLPVSDLKIDLSLVLSMEHKPGNQGVVRAIVTMAQSLSLDVVAEGVETASQRELLLQLGCTLHQGYFYDRPLGAGQALDRLKAAGDTPPGNRADADERRNRPG